MPSPLRSDKVPFPSKPVGKKVILELLLYVVDLVAKVVSVRCLLVPQSGVCSTATETDRRGMGPAVLSFIMSCASMGRRVARLENRRQKYCGLQ